MPTTLVLGYDGSDCSKTALARTIDLAGAIPDATVVVVYAYEFSIGYVPIGMTDSPLMMSAESVMLSLCGATARARWRRPPRSSPPSA